MPTCRLCDGTFSIEEMAKNGSQKPSYCRGCCNTKRSYNRTKRLDYFRNYDRFNHKRHRETNPDMYRDIDKQHHLRNSVLRPAAVRAVNTVNNDLKSPNGILVKLPCRVCGAAAQAHHEDYSKPLDVVWLCPVHHNQRHRELQNMMKGE